MMLCSSVSAILFLSTPSARRATDTLPTLSTAWMISIHALREEGDLYPVEGDGLVGISIHALREEGDASCPTSPLHSNDFYPRPPRGGRLEQMGYNTMAAIFLSTPSARRATSRAWSACGVARHFYPRPPRGGRPDDLKPIHKLSNFYPRPPRGGRPGRSKHTGRQSGFLSTPSARRATF